MKVAQPNNGPRTKGAFTLTEVVVSLLVLSIVVIALYAAFSAGFAFVQLSRENLRATQIMVQKMENVRLYKWSQLNSNGFFAGTFTTSYDPIANSGATYYCVVSTNSVPNTLPADYRNNMVGISMTIYWTNYPQLPNTNIIVRSRQMQTFVARYGMQNYNYNFAD